MLQSDSHKNKAWQEHAAAVAAAFAKELLNYVQRSDIEGELLVKDVLNESKWLLLWKDIHSATEIYIWPVQRVHKKVDDGFKETKNDLSDLLEGEAIEYCEIEPLLIPV